MQLFFLLPLLQIHSVILKSFIMKKFLSVSLLMALLLSFNFANAQAPYKHSIGATLGSMQAISYKTFPGNHFAVSLDLGTKFIRTRSESIYWGWGVRGNVELPLYTFELNANFMYEGNFTKGLYGLIGGGPSMGFCFNNNNVDIGKFGVNAILGLEYKFNIPLALQFDFRPGYGLLFDEYSDLSYFDWNLNIGIRYTF